MVTHSVLVTGITGFVGAYLARALLKQQNEIVALARIRSDGANGRLLEEFGLVDSIRIVNGDVSNFTTMLNVVHEYRPDWIFHLASQSFVPRSFRDPLTTFTTNCLGTLNILEAIRIRDHNSRFIFAGSSEEYGLQFINKEHLESMRSKYGDGAIEPLPDTFPELPIDETNPLRPMSPYATSKLYGDYCARNYHYSYGLDSIVSRAFNHEGAGRGPSFVTSSIVRQLVATHLDERKSVLIGDVSSFRDWSHVEDIVLGYLLLAEKAPPGSVYVQGSMRTNSVLTYLLKTISLLGYDIVKIMTLDGSKKIKEPLHETRTRIGTFDLNVSKVDELLLNGTLSYSLNDKALIVETSKRPFRIEFDKSRFRSSDVPILLANIRKIKELGYVPQRSIDDIIEDQINYYLDPVHRKGISDVV